MSNFENSLPRVEILLSIFKPNIYRLRKQLESIHAQDGISVVLSARFDGQASQEYIDSLCVPNLTVDEHKGVGPSFMHLIANSKCDYVALCDQDDIWTADKLKLQVNSIPNPTSNPYLITSNYILVDDREVTLGVRNVPRKFSKFTFLFRNPVPGCTMLINKQSADLIRRSEDYFYPQFHHDWWVGLTVSLFGVCSRVNRNLVKYRLHSENTIGSSIDFRERLCNVIARIKHGNYELALMHSQMVQFIDSDPELRHKSVFMTSIYMGLFKSRLNRLTILAKHGIHQASFPDKLSAFVGYVLPAKLISRDPR